MSQDVKMTRSEELRLKERIELASSGHGILEKKRDGLIHEFMEIVDEARESEEELSQAYSDALEAMKDAEVVDGREEVIAAATGMEDRTGITTGTKNIMGVRVPQISASQDISRSLSQRGYSLDSTTSRIDAAADAYEELLEQVVRSAEVQTRVLKLLEEIEKTKRRVNALEHKVIPEMEEALETVSQALEEREREETFRMKKIKEMSEED